MEELHSYICLSPMTRDGEKIKAGGTVKLTDREAEQHLDSGVIEPLADEPDPEPEPEPEPTKPRTAKRKTAGG